MRVFWFHFWFRGVLEFPVKPERFFQCKLMSQFTPPSHLKSTISFPPPLGVALVEATMKSESFRDTLRGNVLCGILHQFFDVVLQFLPFSHGITVLPG